MYFAHWVFEISFLKSGNLWRRTVSATKAPFVDELKNEIPFIAKLGRWKISSHVSDCR